MFFARNCYYLHCKANIIFHYLCFLSMYHMIFTLKSVFRLLGEGAIKILLLLITIIPIFLGCSRGNPSPKPQSYNPKPSDPRHSLLSHNRSLGEPTVNIFHINYFSFFITYNYKRKRMPTLIINVF